MHKQIQTKLEEILQSLSCHDEQGIGLLAGKSGIALLQWHYAKLFKQPLYEEQALQNIEKAFEEIESNPDIINTFCAGTAGVGWFLEYAAKQQWLEEDTNELLADLDNLLHFKLNQFLQQHNWDFLHGAVGLGFYFLSRQTNTTSVTDSLDTLLLYLEHTAEQTPDKGYKWKSVLNHETNQIGYNISISHGMSSIVVLLSKMYQLEQYKDRSKILLEGVVNYILAQEIDKEKYGSYFPSYAIESEEELRASRLAWCYGDLGIAMALWQAGIAMQNENWKNKAIEVLLFAAENRHDLQQEFVMDAGLCHGSAGIAHIFYRAWWNTRMPEFKQAADYWFETTLKMAYHTDGLAGFKTWRTPEYGGWQNSYSVLEGIAGIGLAMLSYITETEPTWDECLLLS